MFVRGGYGWNVGWRDDSCWSYITTGGNEIMVTNYIDREQARNLMRHKQDALTWWFRSPMYTVKKSENIPIPPPAFSASTKRVCCKYKDGW